MNKDVYHLIEATADEKWDSFIDASANSTIFSTSVYLKASDVKYRLYYCYKKQELRGAIALVEDEEGKKVVLDDLIIYNGIMYNKPANKQNKSQQLSEQFKIQEFIALELMKLYENIELSLHPSIIDIRSFVWVNYSTDLPQYKSDIRYTTYVDISDFKDSKKLEDIAIYNEASMSRRQQIRYALKKGYSTKSTNDVDLFVEFYKRTMYRQEIDVENEKLLRMQKLSLKLIESNMAKLYASYDENNEIGSMALFCWDNKRAYYLFGANDPNKRNGHSGTSVLWEAFYDLNKMGINEVDLEGVNSPHRGWFKLSFGGNIVPYYEIKLGE